MDYDTVRLDDENNAVVIIDQTKLPGKIEIISLHTAQEIWNAIYLLQVRGAPAIGVAAAYGIYVLAKRMDTEDYDTFYREFVRQKEYLDSSRPTAVNLSWALNRMQRVVEAHSGETVAQIKEALHRESVAIQEEDIWVCRMIGEHGLTLVKPGDGILTHCNAGQLATLAGAGYRHNGGGGCLAVAPVMEGEELAARLGARRLGADFGIARRAGLAAWPRARALYRAGDRLDHRTRARCGQLHAARGQGARRARKPRPRTVRPCDDQVARNAALAARRSDRHGRRDGSRHRLGRARTR